MWAKLAEYIDDYRKKWSKNKTYTGVIELKDAITYSDIKHICYIFLICIMASLLFWSAEIPVGLITHTIISILIIVPAPLLLLGTISEYALVKNSETISGIIIRLEEEYISDNEISVYIIKDWSGVLYRYTTFEKKHMNYKVSDELMFKAANNNIIIEKKYSFSNRDDILKGFLSSVPSCSEEQTYVLEDVLSECINVNLIEYEQLHYLLRRYELFRQHGIDESHLLESLYSNNAFISAILIILLGNDSMIHEYIPKYIIYDPTIEHTVRYVYSQICGCNNIKLYYDS